MSLTLITAKSAAIQATSAISLAYSAVLTEQAGGDGLDPASIVLDITAASEIALATVQGTVVEAELELEDGVVVWELEVVTPDGQGAKIVMDADGGAMFESEPDD